MTRRSTAPKHLHAAGRTLWLAVVRDYALEPFHLTLLQAACEARDRLDEARVAIDRDGAVVGGLHGPKASPWVAIERDSRVAMARLLRELGLDLETPTTPRPPTRWRPS